MDLSHFGSCFVLVLLHPRKTTRHAPQGMVCIPNPCRMVQCHPWSRPPAEQWPRRQEQWREWNYGQRLAFPETRRSQVQRRWQRNIPRLNPDEVQAAARARVARLEEALKVLGEDDSTEVRGLQATLQEARHTAQDRSMAAQVEECQAFIQRSQRRLARLEEEQAKEQEQLDAAQRRMAMFREEMARTVPPTTLPVSETTQPGKIPDLVAEVDRLRAQVKERRPSARRHGRNVPDLCRSFSRPGWWIRFDFAKVGRTRRTRGARQRSHHGDVDQPRQYVGGEFEPFQSVGLTDLRSSHHRVSTARRVTVWGARGVRVVEAKNPGPGDRDGGATQLDSGADFSISRRSGLTESVDALEFDLTYQDFSSETDTVSVCSEIHRSDSGIIAKHGGGMSGSRIGRTDRVCPSGCAIAQSVRQQRWSPLKVPLMWGAAGNAESVPVLDWITQMCQRIREPLTFFESNLTATEAVGLGWASLREVFRRWNIREQEDFTIWFRREGFTGAQPGNHISARAQEHLLTSECREDARVALLESVYVEITLHVAREGAANHPQQEGGRASQLRVRVPLQSEDQWHQLDHFDLENVFSLRVPTLKACPNFLRSRFRECMGVALRERFKAKQAGDVDAETRETQEKFVKSHDRLET